MATYPHQFLRTSGNAGAIGVKSIDDLFAEIPPELRLQGELNLPAGMSESEMARKVARLAETNETVDKNVCFPRCWAP